MEKGEYISGVVQTRHNFQSLVCKKILCWGKRKNFLILSTETSILESMLEENETFDFVVIGGKDCLFATLQGSNQIILHKFTVELPLREELLQ